MVPVSSGFEFTTVRDDLVPTSVNVDRGGRYTYVETVWGPKEEAMDENDMEEALAEARRAEFAARMSRFEVEWSPEAEVALARARESFEVEDVEGFPVLGYVEDDGLYFLGLVVVALGSALTTSAVWLLAWTLWA